MSSLSILIPTLQDAYRFRMLKRLNEVLDPQIAKYKDRVQKVVCDAGRSMSIGEKRNWLIANSSGDYIVYIDDDDMIPAFYLSEIFKAMESKPDVITFNGYYTHNRVGKKPFEIKLGNGYHETKECFFRWPNHIVPIRRDAIKSVRFPHVREREDYLWSKEINDRKLLKTSVHIDKEMYWYDYIDPKNRIS
jgi:glycosyltransferase involved in cell wall biosynthesis